MKNYIFIVVLLFSFSISSGQAIRKSAEKNDTIIGEENHTIKLDIGNHVTDICDANNVLALFPSLTVEEEPFLNIKKHDILQKLNAEVKLLHDLPEYSEERMIFLLINCKGILLKSEMDEYGRNDGLNKEIEKVFNYYKTLKPTQLKGKELDSGLLMYLNIENGKFTFSPT